MDIIGTDTHEPESLTKNRKLYSEPSDPASVPSPSSQDAIMVAVSERTGPFPLPHPIQLTHPTQPSSTLHPYGPSPTNIRARAEHPRVAPRPVSPPIDVFAHDLRRLAAAAFANLPESDRDRFIHHWFSTGLRDRIVSGVLLLHPSANLSSAVQQCRLYEECYARATGPLHRTNSPTRTPPHSTDGPNLPVRFPDYNPGCPYCAAFGPQARRCGHNQPKGHKMLALVDTGANVSLVNSCSLIRELHEQFDHTGGPHTLRAANGTLIPILGRITLRLTTDNTECQFLPGHKHANADALSRLPDSPPTETETHTASVNAITMSETTHHTWEEARRTDPDTATIYHN
ncbi:hypothetical protein SprV_0501876900 [Sparganum proliferum]